MARSSRFQGRGGILTGLRAIDFFEDFLDRFEFLAGFQDLFDFLTGIGGGVPQAQQCLIGIVDDAPFPNFGRRCLGLNQQSKFRHFASEFGDDSFREAGANSGWA